MCDEYHDAFISLSYIMCPFCTITLRVVRNTYSMCCDNPNIVVDDSFRRCTNCYWFEYLLVI